MKRTRVAGAAAVGLGIAGGAGLALAALSPSAVSAAAPRYAVSASGTGMKVAVGTTTVVLGSSAVSAGQGAPTHAQRAGELTPGAVAAQVATAPSAGTAVTRPQQCAQPSAAFPAPLGTAVKVGVGCGAASASESAAGAPSASAVGRVASLTVGALPSLLSAPVTPGGTVAAKLETALGTLPTLPTTGVPLATVLGQVASASGGSLSGLLSATVGGSSSTISTSGSTVTAGSQDTGARLDLLPGLGASGAPLLAITVGKGDTEVQVDEATGHIAEFGTAAAVSVTVTPATGPAHTVAVSPGASQTFLAGTPLATTIAVGAGSTTSGPGTGVATAQGVEIHLAQGVGATSPTGANGGIVLDLGASTATASALGPPAVAAASTPPPTTAPVPPAPAVVTGATTVHTGEPWSGPLPLAALALALALLAGAGLLARRRLAPLAHLALRAAGRGRRALPVSHHSAGPDLRDLLRSPSGSGAGPAVPRVDGSPPGPAVQRARSGLLARPADPRRGAGE